MGVPQFTATATLYQSANDYPSATYVFQATDSSTARPERYGQRGLPCVIRRLSCVTVDRPIHGAPFSRGGA